ncbi:MAG: PhzF family phenazine biosynthesis protein [Thermoplasmata archaeon]|nr:PhzF family phenazine biosynthesis protein [Thermoplasmata archaeon]
MAERRAFRYRVVDVFAERPLEGNPLAVFPDAGGIDDTTMQAIARELNLSETVFGLPAAHPECAARLRIFTPAREMAFAGHPTIGGAFVLRDEGIVPAQPERFLLQERVGPVPVEAESGPSPMLWLTTPPIRDGRRYDRDACARTLGLDPGDLLEVPPQWLSAGNPTIFVAVKSRAAVDSAWLDKAGSQQLQAPGDEPFCVFVFTPTRDGAYSRMFAPEYGIVEDPATGSSTGPLTAFMMRHGLAPASAGTRLRCEQGTKMGRRSILHVRVRGDQGAEGIDVGGNVIPLAEATMTL